MKGLYGENELKSDNVKVRSLLSGQTVNWSTCTVMFHVLNWSLHALASKCENVIDV